MANIPSALLTFNKSNVDYLRARCLKLIEGGVKQESLASAAAEWDSSDFSKWVRGVKGAKKFGEERYISLLREVAAQDGIEPENYDEVFFGIARFLGCPADRTLARSSDFIGSYRVYRYSLLAPGYILQGSLQIIGDVERNALRTAELYRIQADMLTRVKNEPEKPHLFEKRVKAKNLDFPRSGYFFSRGQDSFIIISKKTRRQDNDPVELQTMYFDNIYMSAQDPQLMFGIFSDWHGDRFYTGRVVAQKLEEPLTDERIETLDPNDVNDVVNAYLTEDTAKRGFVVAYP